MAERSFHAERGATCRVSFRCDLVEAWAGTGLGDKAVRAPATSVTAP